LFLKPYPMKILRPECPLVLWDMWGLHVDKRHNMACPTRLLESILWGTPASNLSLPNVYSPSTIAAASSNEHHPMSSVVLVWPADQMPLSLEEAFQLEDLVHTCYGRWTKTERALALH
jgi:hypothetical protein